MWDVSLKGEDRNAMHDMTGMPKGMEHMNINNVHGINKDTYNVMASVVKSLNLQLRHVQ